MSNQKHSSNTKHSGDSTRVLSAIPKLGVEDCFVIPHAYFDRMQQKVINHAFVKASNNFVVPPHYFNTLSEKVCNHAFVSNNSTFPIPENYFEQLPSTIEQKVVGVRISSINQEIPEGYFEQLPVKIQDRLYQQKKQAAVYRMPQFAQLRPVLAAATIVLLIAMLFYLKIFDNATQGNDQLAVNKHPVNHMVILNEQIHEYDENILIEAIDQPLQIDIASQSEQQLLNEHITDFLIDNQITTDDIASEI
jgi:hypothetical protein